MIGESPQIDEFEASILRLLSRDGRMTIQELSDQVGLSPTPVTRRLRSLEDRGIITGYSAIIDEAALGYEISVFVSVQLDKQIDQALVTFENAIRDLPQVVDCWLMTGNRDYLMRIATRNLATFEAFLTGTLTKIPGVSNIESSIPIRRIKTGFARKP